MIYLRWTDQIRTVHMCELRLGVMSADLKHLK